MNAGDCDPCGCVVWPWLVAPHLLVIYSALKMEIILNQFQLLPTPLLLITSFIGSSIKSPIKIYGEEFH